MAQGVDLTENLSLRRLGSWMEKLQHPRKAQCVYSIQLNKEVGLLHTSEQGGRFTSSPLAPFLQALQFSGCKLLEDENYGGHFCTHSVHIHTWSHREDFFIPLSLVGREVLSHFPKDSML